MSSFKDSFWGAGGFDELRKFIKQGNEFCKELAGIIQERSELEQTYAKGLLKLGLKINKTTSSCIGTLSSAWGLVATEMEAEAEVRKNLAISLFDDIYKPLKALSESQYKTRKPITTVVDKAITTLHERRSDENRSKKSSYTLAKEAEKVNTSINDARSGKGKVISEKDITKIDKKLKQVQAQLTKADSDYHDNCLKAEVARQEWEMTVYKASSQLQVLEEERIENLKHFLSTYCNHVNEVPLKLTQSCDRLREAALVVDVATDLAAIVEQRGTGPNQPEQILFDSYAEDSNNSMDIDRRHKSLLNYLLYFQQDITREQKGKEGVEKLLDVYKNRPGFADEETVDNSTQKLLYTNAMLNYLDACHYKLQCAIAQMNQKPKPSHRFSQYIQHLKDKQGHAITVLKLPSHLLLEGLPADFSTYHREAGDGGHDNPHPAVELNYRSSVPHNTRPMTEIYDEDEFDNYDGVDDMCNCEAIYDYVGQQADELTIKQGDVIQVFERGDDGWWRGECRGQSGLFPATYVQVT